MNKALKKLYNYFDEIIFYKCCSNSDHPQQFQRQDLSNKEHSLILNIFGQPSLDPSLEVNKFERHSSSKLTEGVFLINYLYFFLTCLFVLLQLYIWCYGLIFYN